MARLRLEALAAAAERVAAPELESGSPATAMMKWCVRGWSTCGARRQFRGGIHGRATLTVGSDPVRWLRRSGELAMSGKMTDKAMTAFGALVATGKATKKDRFTYAELALSTNDYARALPVLDGAVADVTACDDPSWHW